VPNVKSITFQQQVYRVYTAFVTSTLSPDYTELINVIWLPRVRSRRLTSTRCTSKPDPTNLHQDEGWWAAFTEVETRACGQPSTTWIHQICRDTGVTATEALQLAEDRPFWRTIATEGGSGWALRVTTMTIMVLCHDEERACSQTKPTQVVIASMFNFSISLSFSTI